jgi:hypothetical protein
MRSLYRATACALFVSLISLAPPAIAKDRIYEGTWKTTNRKLDGAMTSVVTDLGGERWKGRFYGVWQGVPFDYNVTFAGPPSDLRGTATIDNAHYDWRGAMSDESPGRFTGSFGGSRYAGHFDLTAKDRPVTR